MKDEQESVGSNKHQDKKRDPSKDKKTKPKVTEKIIPAVNNPSNFKKEPRKSGKDFVEQRHGGDRDNKYDNRGNRKYDNKNDRKRGSSSKSRRRDDKPYLEKRDRPEEKKSYKTEETDMQGLKKVKQYSQPERLDNNN